MKRNYLLSCVRSRNGVPICSEHQFMFIPTTKLWRILILKRTYHAVNSDGRNSCHNTKSIWFTFQAQTTQSLTRCHDYQKIPRMHTQFCMRHGPPRLVLCWQLRPTRQFLIPSKLAMLLMDTV